MTRRLPILVLCSIAIFAFTLFSFTLSTSGRLTAQIDPTAQQQTIDAAVVRQFGLTATAQAPLNATQTLQAAFNHALTATAGYQRMLDDAFYRAATATATALGTYVAPLAGRALNLFDMTAGDTGSRGSEQWIVTLPANVDFGISISTEDDLYVDVYTNAGELLISSYGQFVEGRASASVTVPIVSEGQYQIMVSGYEGETNSAYTIYPVYNEIQDRAEVPLEGGYGDSTYGQLLTVSGTVTDTVGRAHTFVGAEGTYVTISVIGDFDTYLILEDMRGAVIATDDDSGGSLQALINVQLPSTTEYLAIVRGYRGAEGNYELTVSGTLPIGQAGSQSIALPNQTVGLNASVSGQVNIGQGENWAFSAPSAVTVNIYVESVFDSILTIFDAQGTEIASDDDSGGMLQSRISNFEVQPNQQYIIVVAGFGDNTGQYSLYVEETNSIVGLWIGESNADDVSLEFTSDGAAIYRDLRDGSTCMGTYQVNASSLNMRFSPNECNNLSWTIMELTDNTLDVQSQFGRRTFTR